MIKISEATAIAMHAVTMISANKGRCVSLREIADKFDVSDHHLSKVLQRLIKSGILVSTKGPKGGFQIKKTDRPFTFLNVYEAIEGKYQTAECLFSKARNKCDNCIMNNILCSINKQFYDYISNTEIK